jgi:CheY-like chemotaxis protein
MPNKVRTILVVDDDVESVHALGEILQREGFGVVTATDGKRALDHLASNALPDAMVIDLMMPGMDGWALAHELRAEPRLASLPVVVISGAGERAMARSPLADGHFMKPVDFDRLLALLRRLIAERSASGSDRPTSATPSARQPVSERMVVPVVLAVDCAPSFHLTRAPVVERAGAVLKMVEFDGVSKQVIALRPVALIAPAALYERDGHFLEVLGRSVEAQLITEEQCEDPVELETRLRSSWPPAAGA